MVRLLIEDVTIRKGEQVQLDVRFRGGTSKTLMLPRPVSYCESHKQQPEMEAEMDPSWSITITQTWRECLTNEISKRAKGLPLTSVAAGYVRKAYGLKSRLDRIRERGLLTISEMAQVCGVCTKTISEWRQKGLLRGRAINDRNQFLFENPGPTPPKKHRRTLSRRAA